ncbi:DUF6282 family protein [Anaerobacillus sp. MEB173]|uniref:DUF6282 family protein n=1 Tax=Anaerobacillus sp. MEB173 TaxID=3383345 RepID=UPI003F9170DD
MDLHIHSAPDIRERSHDDLELAKQAKEIGVRAVVIKSHYVPTMDRAYLVNKVEPSVRMFGSITLNPSVGGINPFAVEAALSLRAKVVWMPTIFSIKHRQLEGKSGGVETVRDNQVIPELKNVLKLIADNKAILATGHLSPEEIFIVVEEARKQGVENIVITHPEFHVVNLSIPEQIKLVNDYQVFLERTYAQPIGGGKYKSNLLTNLKAIEEVGYKSTIVSTDGGQVENPMWKDVLREYIQYLVDNGISTKAIHTMTRENPAKLLGI